MFEALSEKFEIALKKIRGEARITENNVSETLVEVRKVLLEADVNFDVVESFIENVKQKALGQDVIKNVKPGQLIVKIIYDELVEKMGGVKSEINFSAQGPSVIMVAGLQGSGKTTFSAKLAKLLKSKGKNPILVAADVYRPAAIDQLEILGKIISVPVFSIRNEKATTIAKKSFDFAKENLSDTIIIDTAGRLHIDEVMMNEIAEIKSITNPSEILFVVDSMIGQDAVTTAKSFNDVLNFNGVVLTKLDGDARGGAALSIKSVVNKPIKFIGVGEKLDALEQFHPDRMASRILGMGDVVSLVEKAQETFDKKEADRLAQKIRKENFTLQDFFDQLQQIKKMGSMQQIIGMIPGASKLANADKIDDKSFKQMEAIILSMTFEERNNPNVINGSRRKRIADGSGRNVQEVNQLLKQFFEMSKMMKMMKKGVSMKNAIGSRFGQF